MKWREAGLIVPAASVDIVSLLLWECGTNGSIIHDDKTRDGLVSLTVHIPDEGADTVIARMKACLDALWADNPAWQAYTFVQGRAEEDTWLYAWQQYFCAEKISERFWVVPVWEKTDPPDAAEVLRIEPGVTFGSGFHDTTRMCVRYLEKFVRPGQIVYDIGTGTGILAVTAAKCGAAAVRAVDFDPAAVKQAAVNAKLNGVDEILDISRRDLLNDLGDAVPRADLIVGNVVTDLILRLLPELPSYLKENGIFIGSGIIDERIDEVRQVVRKRGFTQIAEDLENGWYTVVLRKT